MTSSERAGPDPSRRGTISRPAALALGGCAWLFAIPLIHGALPCAIGWIGPRLGWIDGRPGPWNRAGSAPLASGAALLLWVVGTGYAHARELPERVSLDWTPKLLLVRGPYAWSRNPMYVAELSVWLGWAILFGSVPLLAIVLVSCLAIRLLVRREERDLEAAFGDAYRAYRARVRRWI